MNFTLSVFTLVENCEGHTCIDGGHSSHQFGVNLVGFHPIIFTVFAIIYSNLSVTTSRLC